MTGRACRCLVAALAFAIAAPLWAQTARLLDGFEELAPWQAQASDGVQASARPVEGKEGRALRLDFEFGKFAGYAFARRKLPLDLPPNYEISFYMRADAPVNHFELKLVDASGANVWWRQWRDFDFPRQWQLVKIKKRQIEFAWGPTRDRTLTHADQIEFVVSAGSGGRGSVEIDQLSIRELPPEPQVLPAPSAQASSALAGGEPALALDSQPATAWRSDPATGAAQSYTVDFGRAREFGGLVLRWLDRAFASRYDVQFSDDGAEWRTVRRVVDGNGGADPLLLTESDTRFVRLLLHDGPAHAYALAELEVKELAFGATPNAFFQALAREWPRGQLPRGFSGEQPYWTVVGTDGGGKSALLSEDGAVEIDKAGFSIEPFVVSGSKVTTWADIRITHSLLDNYLPVPSVTWHHPQWEMQVTSFASGAPKDAQLVTRYELRNLTAKPLALTLMLAVRPFQVNPPMQFLNTPGGVSPIRDLAWDGVALSVNGAAKVFPLHRPDAVGAAAFDAGWLPAHFSGSAWAGAHAVRDDAGLASGALAYRIMLAPHSRQVIGFTAPLAGQRALPDLRGESVAAWISRQERGVAEGWRIKLNKVSMRVPPQAQVLVDTLRSSLAHMLMLRDGPILRPGARSYERSWIRDGAMMSEALLRLGHETIAADYLRWYAPYQFENGKVPCCVDRRGADPVPENDSHGQLIFLAAETWRYTRDRALLETMWPHVANAMRYMEEQRQTERAPSAPALFRGLLPKSISHEGYSEQPMHSYWDDFWALRGYKDAVGIAAVLGRQDAAQAWAGQRDQFSGDLYASLRAAVSAHSIAHLPGAAELGDFDPTSTTVALSPGGEQAHLPQDLLSSTFERYWTEFQGRRDGSRPRPDYTPYEWRTVSAFVRLGWRERAWELSSFFFGDRRPAAWNQWAEVVMRDPREPHFLGDMPHGWISSDYIRSALDMFAYEREADHALVLGAGIPWQWLDGAGVAIKDLRTPYGPLRYSIKRQGGRILLDVPATIALPPGGLVLAVPAAQASGPVRINGRPARWRGNELNITTLPAVVAIGVR